MRGSVLVSFRSTYVVAGDYSPLPSALPWRIFYAKVASCLAQSPSRDMALPLAENLPRAERIFATLTCLLTANAFHQRKISLRHAEAAAKMREIKIYGYEKEFGREHQKAVGEEDDTLHQVLPRTHQKCRRGCHPQSAAHVGLQGRKGRSYRASGTDDRRLPQGGVWRKRDRHSPGDYPCKHASQERDSLQEPSATA